MDIIAESFPEQTAVDARPSVIVPGISLDRLTDQGMFVAVIRGDNSGTLRLIAYRRDGDKLIRVAHSAPTGRIKGTPAVCLFRERGLVTASHGQNSNRLFLIHWFVVPDGRNGMQFERNGDSGSLIGTPGGSSDLVWVGGRRIAVAVITEGGDLKVISFDISSGGVFDRVSDSGNAAGEITSPPTIAWRGGESLNWPLPLNNSGSKQIVVTAFRSSEGRLKLISWSVENDRVHRLSDTGNGGIKMDGRPAISSAGDGSLIGVATRHNDHYHLSVWNIDRDGRFTNANRIRSGSSVSGSPAITYLARDKFVVATRAEPGGDLLVETWKFSRSSEGLDITRRAAGFANNIGCVGSPSICSASIGPSESDVITAIRNKDQRLAVHRWRGDLT